MFDDESPAAPSRSIIASKPRFGEVTIRSRGRLPHWEKDSGVYFVTFRLADSLPESLLQRTVDERHAIVANAAALGRELSSDERKRIATLSNRRIEEFLDRGAGACYMRNPAVAKVVADGLRYFNETRYRLIAWCVMPNHVHVVVKLRSGEQLSRVVHSWKSFTATKANRVLHRSGPFWQREYYDHLIRDGNELERAVRYVVNNPVGAGLSDWPWVEVVED